MLRKRLTIISCSVYGPELISLSINGRIPYPVRFADSSLHMRPDSLQYRLQMMINEERAEGRYVVLVYGDCASSMMGLTSQEGVFRVKGNNCGDIFLAPIEIITAPLRGHVGDADIISDNLLSHTASGVL